VAKERFSHRGETRHMESHGRGIGLEEKENPRQVFITGTWVLQQLTLTSVISVSTYLKHRRQH